MRFYRWRNKLTALWLLLLLVASGWLASLWFARAIHIQTNLFALLPPTAASQQVADVQAQLAQHMDSKLFVAIDGDDEAQVLAATEQLARNAAASNFFKPLEQGSDQRLLNAFYAARAGLLAPEDRRALAQGDWSLLTERSLLQLVSAGFPVTAALLQDDPLLLFPRYLLSLGEAVAADVAMEGGRPTLRRNGRVTQLLVLELASSPYQIDFQEASATWIAAQRAELAALGVQSHWTGTLMFASFGTQSAQQEISTIGVGSSIGLVLLVWFGFRSLRPLATEFIAVSSGSLLALAATHAVFGEIHLMTLLFGASLIGVCVDFSFYFMAMQSQQRERDGFAVLLPLLPSLFVGLLTTLLAYVFLSLTPFPGFKQIAVFSVVGLAAAWISSVLLLPRLKPLNASAAIATLAPIARARAYFQADQRRPYGLMALLFIGAAVGITQLRANDDIRSLQSLDAKLQADDQFIQQRFGHQQAANYLLLQAPDSDRLQALEQQVLQALQPLQTAGDLQGVQALGLWLRPDRERAEVIAQLKALPETWLREYAAALQLEADDVLQWQRSLAATSAAQASLINAHPLGFLQVSATARVIALQGLREPAALAALLQSEADAQVLLVQPVVELSRAFAEQRRYAQYLLTGAIGALALGLAALYGWRSVCPLLAPVTLALLCSFALLALFKVEINLFNIMATFLVLGIGVDYAIFYRHGGDHSGVVAMALSMCMVSTLLGFGLLALSNTYAVFSFGVTVLLGVSFSYVFATLMTAPDNHYRAGTAAH